MSSLLLEAADVGFRRRVGCSAGPPLDGGVGSDFVTCEGNRFTYDQRNVQMHSIRAEAASGEVFEGRITPVMRASAAASPSCSCEASGLVDITIELAKE